MSQSKILEGYFNQCVRETDRLFENIKKAVDKGIEYGKEDFELIQKTVEFIIEVRRLIENLDNDLIKKYDGEIKSFECFNEMMKVLKK